MVASWSQAAVFLASYAQKSREENGKKANKFLPLADLVVHVFVAGSWKCACTFVSARMTIYSYNMPHTLMGNTHKLESHS